MENETDRGCERKSKLEKEKVRVKKIRKNANR